MKLRRYCAKIQINGEDLVIVKTCDQQTLSIYYETGGSIPDTKGNR